MKLEFSYCPGTLALGGKGYSRTCLNRVFNGRSVSPILPYASPFESIKGPNYFDDNRERISISGVQEKYSLVLLKNKLRLSKEGELSQYLLKPIPAYGKNADQMPANEHLTMQLARQVFGIETAENALIFFQDGSPAYITKRFDRGNNKERFAHEGFAMLAKRTPQTDGQHYKYKGNYLDLFNILKAYVPAYPVEAVKLMKLLLFNYLFSNGDAHLKNFAILETPMGDHRLSPDYDLLNTRIHIEDPVFALEEGLLPKSMAKGKMRNQFERLALEAGINLVFFKEILDDMLDGTKEVDRLIEASFLNERTKRNYWQAYQTRLKRLLKT
ncbi:MAG: HipA domain-containing protein [Bacteroidota bacterium]